MIYFVEPPAGTAQIEIDCPHDLHEQEAIFVDPSSATEIEDSPAGPGYRFQRVPCAGVDGPPGLIDFDLHGSVVLNVRISDPPLEYDGDPSPSLYPILYRGGE
jgi:hypothetical protein